MSKVLEFIKNNWIALLIYVLGSLIIYLATDFLVSGVILGVLAALKVELIKQDFSKMFITLINISYYVILFLELYVWANFSFSVFGKKKDIDKKSKRG